MLGIFQYFCPVNPNIYFTQISNLSEARFATSVMAEGIAFCLEPKHPDHVNNITLNGFKDWLVGSDWIASLSDEPNEEIRAIMDHFGFKYALIDTDLYQYTSGEVLIDTKNKVKTLEALQSKEDFERALKQKSTDVLLFGTKEEEVGMANMDRWLDYFEALEIL